MRSKTMRFKMHIVGSLLGILLATELCTGANHVVRMEDNRFVPRNITVAVGDTIRWENVGDNTHTATADDQSDPNAFDTGDVEPGDSSAAVRFNVAADEVPYHCQHHSRMTGTIRVVAARTARRVHRIEMRDYAFAPRNITIDVGDSIIWENVGDSRHTATADDVGDPNYFDTMNIDTGEQSAPIQFNVAGNVSYHCERHPSMRGRITVRDRVSQPKRVVSQYGSNFPRSVRTAVGRIRTAERPPDLNDVYYDNDFGRHYLGERGHGLIIANDFGQNHIAARLEYAGETDQLWIYDIVGLNGPQHAYQKEADPGQYGVWYRPNPSEPFFFWFYGDKVENNLPPPDLD
jgi:plastocyanin